VRTLDPCRWARKESLLMYTRPNLDARTVFWSGREEG
jgi:hypothetical protein